MSWYNVTIAEGMYPLSWKRSIDLLVHVDLSSRYS